MDAFLRDLRFAFRGLVRTPGFSIAAVVALALGIGATTAIFSVVHAVLLRSLGWGDESRLVSVYRTFEGIGQGKGTLSVGELYSLQEAPSLESVGSFNPGTAALQGGDRAERVQIARVTSGFFSTLGVRPQFGRVFTAEEDLEGNDGVALVSAPAFHRRFGGDPTAVGRSITLDGRSYRIIGVLPEGFTYNGTRDFLIPYGFTPRQRLQEHGAHYLQGLAKLRRGVSMQAANKEVEQVSMRFAAAYPNNYLPEFHSMLHIEPLRERFVASSRQPILVLFGAVLLVLLIACGNVANLLLARSAVREREFAVRAALGAGRARIVRQLLTEGLLLAAVGTTLGVLLAGWGLDALLVAAPRQIRDFAQVRVDKLVLAFSAGLTVATTVGFALVPALRASRVELAASLKEGGHGSAGVPAARLRTALVVAQVAVSLFLLVGAGLLLRSFAQVLRVSPGFDPEGTIAAELAPAGPAYADPEVRERYFERALGAAAAIPGVTAAGGINLIPTRGKFGQTYSIEGHELRAGEPLPTDEFRCVLPGYFTAMRQPIVAGREFSAADDAKAPNVILVNEAWVRRYFPGRDVIGRRMNVDTDRHRDAWRTIVGVVGDAREYGLDEPVPPVFYFAAAQEPPDFMTIVVRTVVIGLAIGAAVALAGARLIASQLYGVSARDPVTFAAIAGLLLAVALAASGIPALRAARIDPMSALRAE
jgi:predicted permease